MKDNSLEKFPIVDEEGHVLGSATRGECHSGSKLLHPVVHLHVFNSKGEVYLQRRPDWKDIQPGKNFDLLHNRPNIHSFPFPKCYHMLLVAYKALRGV